LRSDDLRKPVSGGSRSLRFSGLRRKWRGTVTVYRPEGSGGQGEVSEKKKKEGRDGPLPTRDTPDTVKLKSYRNLKERFPSHLRVEWWSQIIKRKKKKKNSDGSKYQKRFKDRKAQGWGDELNTQGKKAFKVSG